MRKQKMFHNFRGIVKTEESKFKLWTASKIMFIPFVSMIFISFFIWIFIKMNNIFFEANGFPGIDQLREAYYDFILGDINILILAVSLFSAGLFVVGHYMASLLLRPFNVLGEYCRRSLEGTKMAYNPDVFSDLKLLTRFSEYFFHHIELSKTQGKLLPVNIPPHYAKVRRPVFEKVFFFHFCLFLLMVSLISSVAIYVMSVEIHGKIVELAMSTLKHQASVAYFLQEQRYLLESVLTVSIFALAIFYVALAFHIYHKVSGAAFGVFSTMRAFLKGDLTARVHLIGYNHVRTSCRWVNKYLDHVQKSFDIASQKEPNQSKIQSKVS